MVSTVCRVECVVTTISAQRSATKSCCASYQFIRRYKMTHIVLLCLFSDMLSVGTSIYVFVQIISTTRGPDIWWPPSSFPSTNLYRTCQSLSNQNLANGNSNIQLLQAKIKHPILVSSNRPVYRCETCIFWPLWKLGSQLVYLNAWELRHLEKMLP